VNDVERFRRACIVCGIYIERCGLAVRDLLLELRSEPLPVGVSASGGAKTPQHARLGVAIKAKLARFVPEEKHYVITPSGETWLTELEIHGLIGAIPEPKARRQKEAA
jgi:hypothetical protein